MKLFRILTLTLILSLLLCGCRAYSSADFELDRSPIAFAITKEEYANPPQDTKEQEYSHLNQPLHLIPRELLTTPHDGWVQYIQSDGIGVYYLYSYDAGRSVNTYVVFLDIIASTMLPTRSFTAEVGAEYTFYVSQQRIQISPGFIGAVKWDKESDTLAVWEDPPLQPVVQVNSIQMDKGSDEVGTVLTEWLYGATVSDPIPKNDRIIGTNIISALIRRLTVGQSYDGLTRLSYAIIDAPRENGSITEWHDSEEHDFTKYTDAHKGGLASFQNNYITQSQFYGNIALGGLCAYPNGKLTDTAHNIFLECTFSAPNQQFAKHLNWRIDIALSLEK